ncbi:transcription elongation factor GreA [Patescibacteria group bacterium]|nr:transcription elongation factor GreA [Patescibacteria group bacterium]MBU1895350.1 transcription elongation factor GreA [Patescibacteria group bacterium]
MTDLNVQYISEEKREDLYKEIRELKENKIPTIAKRIDEARQMGDLSENAEYHSAREDMAWAQSRAKEIGYILDHAEIVSTQSDKSGSVNIGSTLMVAFDGGEKEFKVVGPHEADPLHGKISNESPIGEAFLGKKKGDKVEVETPAGTQAYKILKVF